MSWPVSKTHFRRFGVVEHQLRFSASRHMSPNDLGGAAVLRMDITIRVSALVAAVRSDVHGI